MGHSEHQLTLSDERLLPGSAAVLMASVFFVAACGLVYELLAGTLSSYLLGNSIFQFSLVIGLFLSAMGVGSFLSRFVRGELLRVFLWVEIAVGVIGGCSALTLFLAFALLDVYWPLLIVLLMLVGILVGLEIPLLVRLLKDSTSLRAALGNVLALDYLGALVASLVFPLVCLPWLGLVRTGFLFGLLNVVVALIGVWVFAKQLGRVAALRAAILAALLLLGLGFVTAGRATTWIEDVLYDDEVVYATTTPYQRLVITRWRDDIRLFLDGNIQFSSADEFRYHESLVHPTLGMLQLPRRILLLGAGDGLAVREVLKHPSVKQVDVVDLDPEMTRLFSRNPLLVKLNQGALNDERVRVINTDAERFLRESQDRYDAILCDLPDPNNESLGKLYSRSFYRLAANHLMPRGILVTQAGSPFYATDAFWCIVNTLKATRISSAGGALYVLPYRANVPSFGVWGFAMASREPLDPSRIRLEVPTRFLTRQLLPLMFAFSKDVAWRQTEINRLDNQVLVQLYEKGYRHYNQ